MNPSPLGIAWGTSREARRRMRDTQASRRSDDDGQWDRFERDWHSHTVEHLMSSRGGRNRKGVRRSVTSLPSHYKRSKSRRR